MHRGVRRGGQVRLIDEVAAVYGHLGLKPVVLRPAFPQGKGFIERMNEYLETSFLPLRTFTGLDDLQTQIDSWTAQVADRRHVRRVGGRVADALAVERRSPPKPTPNTAPSCHVGDVGLRTGERPLGRTTQPP